MRKLVASVAVVVALGAGAVTLFACSESATLPLAAGFGPQPQLPPPNPTLIPTVKIAPAVGWPADTRPTPARGLAVNAFATGLDHPRNVFVLPSGDVLVAETNAPPKPDDSQGIRGFVMRRIMARAGAGVPSANRITLLRDTDGDGVAETRTVFLDGLNSPYGMALIGDRLFVADTDAIRRYRYEIGQTRITDPGERLTALPAGRLNHHWTKNLVASPDGRFLYVSIGSNSNVGENGLEAEEGRAQIWEVDVRTGQHRSYATGLRNPNGLSFAPGPTPMLWAAVNERDEIGSDLVPDYMTSVRDGGFYGWPFSYFGQHVDARLRHERPELVARAIVPDYALGAHTASLGLAITADSGLPAPFTTGAFIGQHGSWNRRPPSGYRVIFVPFSDGRPAGEPIDVLTGFLDEEGQARGRPVGVAPDGRGGLLVADDVGNAIWRVSAAARPPS
ncbi:PQQ-dependent sugar dehydrogenase [Plastoroseomonas hellenica]|uniref:PQQ-dependent sugar dehydrogenase n=1 Tax=Plastoroseomonas hellenica TaxID=2687306 RepID=UPI001BACD97A|nr:sorbosone dehydrogenase family protein [Plastoroseomonas hellenica]MBR0643028.1 sorbosone dehydrogenase family protein [Plastoroseomonas hellenica]